MKGYRQTRLAVGVTLALVLLLTACTLATRGVNESGVTERQLRIVAPANHSTVLQGSTVAVRAVKEKEDPKGIARVQLWVDDQLFATKEITPAMPVTQLDQYLFWTADTAGSHTIQVVVQSYAGDLDVSKPITLTVSADASIRATAIAVQLAPVTPNPFATATPWPTFTFTPLPPTTATAMPITPAPCYDGAVFVADVTVPDGKQFDKGAAFDKVWRLRNTGTCTWGTRYQFVFVEGTRLEGPSPAALPQAVPPGGTVDVTVPMLAPDAIGTYRSRWQMRNPDGVHFGSLVYALIEVRPGPDDPPVVTRFEVVPDAISQGQPATIYWQYVNGTFARLTPGGEGGVGPTGSLVVAPDATTSYRLVVNNAAGSVERTITLVVQPRPTPALPASPAYLTITATRPDGFDFTWTDTSTNEQGFYLHDAGTHQVVATFAPNAVGGVLSGLTCETSYRFYLGAYNQGGESWPSNTVQATTGACGE